MAAALSWIAIATLLPWLQRVASARPEARSSHRVPTPQGAGLAVTGAVVILWSAALVLLGRFDGRSAILAAALAGAMLIGFIDDIRPQPWRLKLVAQALCAAAATTALPAGWPGAYSTGLALADGAIATLVLVAVMNIVNFIDGIDGITAAHSVPAFAVMTLAAFAGILPATTSLVAAAAFGAMIGFWWWNRHPARIFLGDAGSLPVGLLLGWLSLLLAGRGHAAAALLVLAYPLADGGSTLLRRLLAGKHLTEPHRDHAYQRAVDTGLSAPRVTLTVALVSLACAVLAVTSILADHAVVGVGCLAIGLAWVLAPIVGWLRRTPSP
jgi:UDP-N-acetylmuramyl pentapeptide phosphotransferase/UDP-N-acetylglucosamine-1-phosphate transferase